jgi:starvation-inducible DNA-binding protein
MSKTLIVSLKVSLANEFITAHKFHIAHWNVEGINFPQLHELFNFWYNDLNNDIDVIAEHIRTLDEYAPNSLSELLKLTTINDMIKGSEKDLLLELLKSVEETLKSFDVSLQLAAENNKEGIINYLSGRIDTLEKIRWILNVTSK